MKLRPQLESVSSAITFELPINIHVGEIRIERGFKFELFDGNYFDIIDQYNDLYSDLIDIYGKEDIDKLIEICLSVFNNRISRRFYISSKTKHGDRFERGYFTNVNIKDYTKPYKCEGEPFKHTLNAWNF